jgi:hypothetical protein
MAEEEPVRLKLAPAGAGLEEARAESGAAVGLRLASEGGTPPPGSRLRLAEEGAK